MYLSEANRESMYFFNPGVLGHFRFEGLLGRGMRDSFSVFSFV